MTTGVFLDARLFWRHDFDLTSAPFTSLERLARDGLVALLVPDDMRELLRRAVNRRAWQFAADIANVSELWVAVGDGPLRRVEPFDAVRHAARIHERLDAYFVACGAVFLASPSRTVLSRWAREHDADLVVVSHKAEWIDYLAASPRTSQRPTLANAVSALLCASRPHAAALYGAIQAHRQRLALAIGADIEYSICNLEDVSYGEVHRLQLRELTLAEPELVAGDGGRARVEVDVHAEMEADISFADPESFGEGIVPDASDLRRLHLHVLRHVRYRYEVDVSCTVGDAVGFSVEHARRIDGRLGFSAMHDG